MYFRFSGRLAAAAEFVLCRTIRTRQCSVSASALCPREKEQRLCGPGTASANGITPRRRTLLRSTGSGEQQVPVLGSRAYRNHSTRLRVFPLPRGEGRCELVRACFKNPPKRRVRARGLQETMRFRHPCRPGPPTGRFSKHALRKYAKRVKDRDRLTARSESSSRREEALISLLFPKTFEPRYLGCHGKWRFQTGS